MRSSEGEVAMAEREAPEPAGEAVVMYSGGTDSTCAAALMAERFQKLHLLTFHRYGFHHIERSGARVAALAERFPGTEFRHRILRIDKVFAQLAFRDYLSRLKRFGFRMLQQCTFCALANHFAALAYCRQHGIRHVADGVTRELQLLPSHMERPIERMRELYRSYGVEYHTPVYDFDIPKEMSFFDKVLQSEDGRTGVPVEPGARTTGRHLHELGLMPTENIKGSALDRRLQFRCFQYVLHNTVAFYAMPGASDHEAYQDQILEIYEDVLGRFEPDAALLEEGPT